MRHPFKVRGVRRMAVSTPVAVAGLVLTVFVGVAIAKTFTLDIAKTATVTNFVTKVVKHEAIVVNSKGFAVYWLTNDSKAHPGCTKASGCWAAWPPVTVKKGQIPSKMPGIKGKLGVWQHSGARQVTLNGHPLYQFAGDTKKHDATGEGIPFPHGVWHVVTPKTFKPAAANNPNPGGW
jgi:predicted lipoprotein with Yx(FWY)xxD motif